jgi:glycosyltransferase involved in cell wall biosynthesis
VIGGGERYAEELSRAMSARASVRFVSFGEREYRERTTSSYERVILRSWTRDRMSPFSPLLWRELRDASVIHCHQYHVLPTFVAALHGRLHRVPVFASDLGGSGWTPAYHVDQSRWITAHLPISGYAAQRLHGNNRKHRVIYGGIDPARYPMRSTAAHDGSVVFLGRILPHKGIHFLIEGLPAEVPLQIIGAVADPAYLEHLRTLSRGKRVEFLHGLADAQVRTRLRSAMALVHPTPVRDDGDAGVNELFGLAVIEAMASGCPVVLSQAASLPELAQSEVSGLFVPPNDAGAIGDAIRRIRADDVLWNRLAAGARRRVLELFTWDRVVDRCMAAYGGSLE